MISYTQVRNSKPRDSVRFIDQTNQCNYNFKRRWLKGQRLSRITFLRLTKVLESVLFNNGFFTVEQGLLQYRFFVYKKVVKKIVILGSI